MSYYVNYANHSSNHISGYTWDLEKPNTLSQRHSNWLEERLWDTKIPKWDLITIIYVIYHNFGNNAEVYDKPLK